jgi:hypothetical protein
MQECGDCNIYGLVYPVNFNTVVCCCCFYKRTQNVITMIINEKNEILQACWEWVFINHVELKITDAYKNVRSPYW